MIGQTVILNTAAHRCRAKWLIDQAGNGYVANIHAPKRSADQNAKMWAMLSEVSAGAIHNGQRYTPDMWKCIFMHALDHQIRFLPGIDGEMFPVGFRSSRLSKSQMSDLIEYMHWYCAENGVPLLDGVSP